MQSFSYLLTPVQLFSLTLLACNLSIGLNVLDDHSHMISTCNSMGRSEIWDKFHEL